MPPSSVPNPPLHTPNKPNQSIDRVLSSPFTHQIMPSRHQIRALHQRLSGGGGGRSVLRFGGGRLCVFGEGKSGGSLKGGWKHTDDEGVSRIDERIEQAAHAYTFTISISGVSTTKKKLFTLPPQSRVNHSPWLLRWARARAAGLMTTQLALLSTL